MLYGLEMVTLTKDRRRRWRTQVAELKMLRFSLGVTRMDKIRNENTRGTAHVILDRKRERQDYWWSGRKFWTYLYGGRAYGSKESDVAAPDGRSRKKKR